MTIDCLDYRSLPQQNPLFLDFVSRFEPVSPFFNPPPALPEQRARRVEEVLAAPRFPRPELLSALHDFNRGIGAGEKVFDNLRRLESSDAVAAVSGQQVTLFGGPAYSVYKAATAVFLARLLQAEGANAVPVFWLAADDSDFEEVRSSSFFDTSGPVATIRYPESGNRPEQMVGTVPLGAIGRSLSQLQKISADTAFRPETLDALSRAYRPERTFRQAYGAWLSDLFKDYGLIVFDPLSPEVRTRLADFFAVAIERRETIVGDLLRRNEELKSAGYPPQVWIDESESLLFWVDGKNRFKIKFENGRYQVKGRKSVQFTPRELLELAGSEPGRFGANVLLRPILQDYLFPTAIYVGGPAEVAYFAQLNAIAPHWGPRPTIVPRASFTLVDRKSQRLLAKYGLTVQDTLSGSRALLTEKIMRESQTASLLADFDDLRSELEGRLECLALQLKQEDPPLADMLSKAERKILYQIDKVNRRFVLNHEDRVPHLKNHLNHLLNRLLPTGHLQERVINFNQFLAEEGPEFLDSLIERVNPFCFSHRVWTL